MTQTHKNSKVANKVSVRRPLRWHSDVARRRLCTKQTDDWMEFCKPEHRLRTVSIKMEMEKLMKMSLNLKSVWTLTFDWKVDAFLWVFSRVKLKLLDSPEPTILRFRYIMTRKFLGEDDDAALVRASWRCSFCMSCSGQVVFVLQLQRFSDSQFTDFVI